MQRPPLNSTIMVFATLCLQIDNWRPFTFSVVPGNEESETVMAADSEESYNLWLDMLNRQCWLATDASARNCHLDVEGKYRDDATGEIVTTAEAVLAAANAEYEAEMGINGSQAGSVAGSALPTPVPSRPQSMALAMGGTPRTAPVATPAEAPPVLSVGAAAASQPTMNVLPPPPPSTSAATASAFPASQADQLQHLHQQRPIHESRASASVESPRSGSSSATFATGAAAGAASALPLPPPPPPPAAVEPVAAAAALPPPPPAPEAVFVAPSPAVEAAEPLQQQLQQATSFSGAVIPAGPGADRDLGGGKARVEAPPRPQNREVDQSIIAEAERRKPTGSRVKGKIGADIPDAPPRPPERGASSDPLPHLRATAGSAAAALQYQQQQQELGYIPGATGLPIVPGSSSASAAPFPSAGSGGGIVASLSSSGRDFSSSMGGVGARSHMPSSAINPHGMEMPKPKFKAWAETGGLPTGAAGTSSDFPRSAVPQTRPRQLGAGSTSAAAAAAASAGQYAGIPTSGYYPGGAGSGGAAGGGSTSEMLSAPSPLRSYPHGFAAGQRGAFEGLEYQIPSSSSMYAEMMAAGAGGHDDDTESTVGSIAGVPTSITNAANAAAVNSALNISTTATIGGGQKVTFASVPTVMPQAAPGAVAPKPFEPAGLSLTSTAPAYSYPRMGGAGPSSSASGGAPSLMPPPSGGAGYSGSSAATPSGAATTGGNVVPGTRILQPRRFATAAPPEVVAPPSARGSNTSGTAAAPATAGAASASADASQIASTDEPVASPSADAAPLADNDAAQAAPEASLQAPSSPSQQHASHPAGSPTSPGSRVVPRNPMFEATTDAIAAATEAAHRAAAEVAAIINGTSSPDPKRISDRDQARIAADISPGAVTVAEMMLEDEAAGILNGNGNGDHVVDGDDRYTVNGGRSRVGSIDEQALASLDDVNIDNRSVYTAGYDALQNQQQEQQHYGGGGGHGRRAGTISGGRSTHDRDTATVTGTVYTASTLRTIGGTALPFQPLKTVPMREVRRVFDVMTTHSEGLLPLHKLSEISDKLGMPLEPGYLTDPVSVRDVDPQGFGVLSRNDFITWWKRHAVMRVKQFEAEMMRQSALAAVRAREADAAAAVSVSGAGTGAAAGGNGVSARERRAAARRRAGVGRDGRARSRSRSLIRGGGGDGGTATETSTVITMTDRDTVDTFGTYNDTEMDTATQSTATRAYVRDARNRADGGGSRSKFVPAPNPLASEVEAALAAIESGLAATVESAAALVAQLESGEGVPNAASSAADDALVAASAEQDKSQQDQESGEHHQGQQEEKKDEDGDRIGDDAVAADADVVAGDVTDEAVAAKEHLLLADVTEQQPVVEPVHVHAVATIHDHLAAVSEAVKSSQPPSWLSKYGKGSNAASLPLVASAAAAELDASLTRTVQGNSAAVAVAMASARSSAASPLSSADPNTLLPAAGRPRSSSTAVNQATAAALGIDQNTSVNASFHSAISAVVTAAVTAAMGGEVDAENSGAAGAGAGTASSSAGALSSLYESGNHIPMPPCVPALFSSAAPTDASSSPRTSDAPTAVGLGLQHSLAGASLLTAEASRFQGMTHADQEEAVLAAATIDPASVSTTPLADAAAVVQTIAAGAEGIGSLDLFRIHQAEVDHYQSLPEEALNDRWQSLLEAPEWSLAQAVSKGIATSAFLSAFSATAAEAAERIVCEQGLPDSRKSLPPMDLEAAVAAAAAASADDSIEQLPSEDVDAEKRTPPEEAVYFYKGIMLRMSSTGELGASPSSSTSALATAADYTSIPSLPDTTDRKIAGHTLRGLRLATDAAAALYRDWAQSAGRLDARVVAGKRRPPPLSTVLTAMLDFGGFRVYAMAVPPMEEASTLVYGTLGPAQPFVQRSPVVASMLRRVAKHLNLKPHAVQTLSYAAVNAGPGAEAQGASALAALENQASLSERTLVLPLSVDVQGHLCADKRLYLVNLARLMPSDASAASATGDDGAVLPPATGSDDVTCQLRPELVRSYERALSSDAFRSGAPAAPAEQLTIGQPPDATSNDSDAVKARNYLLKTVIPSFVSDVEGSGTAGAAAPPLYSQSLTQQLHARGINARYLGTLASQASLPHVREMIEVEMVARTAKHIVSKQQRRAVAAIASSSSGLSADEHAALVKLELARVSCDIFNLILGTSEETASFWSDILIPTVAAKFGYSIRWDSSNGSSGGAAAAGLNTSALDASSIVSPSSTKALQLPLHKGQLYYALQHHCSIAFTKDLPPVPSAVLALPASSSSPAAAVDHGSASLYAASPSLAPLSTLASPDASSATTFLGLPAASQPLFNFNAAGPFSPNDMLPIAPTTSTMRSVVAGAAIETALLGQSAEDHLHKSDLQGALHALNIRLAHLQSLSGASDTLEATSVLLDIAGAQFGLRMYADVMVTTLAVLARCPGRHVLAAQALLLRARALVVRGDVSTGLACYSQAATAASWHLGRQHPLLAEFAASMATTLERVGLHAAGAGLAASGADLAARVLGHAHPLLPSYYCLAGHLYRQAASSGSRAVATAIVDAADGSSSNSATALARVHVNSYLSRSVQSYERSLILLEAQGSLSISSDTRASIGTVTACLADALAAQGKLGSALAAATKALDIRRSLCDAPAATGPDQSSASASAYAAALHSLQQVAGLTDRLDRPLDCLGALEPIAESNKRQAAEAATEEEGAVAMAAMQRTVRHIVRLGFRALSTHHRSVLQKLATRRAQEVPGSDSSLQTVAFVVSSLLQAQTPFIYVKSVATRALAALGSSDTASLFTPGAGAGASAAAAEPCLADQLCALVGLLARPAAAPGSSAAAVYGGDVTTDCGFSAGSTLGCASSTAFVSAAGGGMIAASSGSQPSTDAYSWGSRTARLLLESVLAGPASVAHALTI